MREDLKKVLKKDLQELQSKVISCQTMTPSAKGMAGMILFKVENDLELNQSEKVFANDLILYFDYKERTIQ
ncbi:hypothetical protein [Bacillus sp. 1P06AnD]|uniref:hypothetical protein n=1 Tax=Bacillus sp. 1P06AnD TaxID=3132208 RepID=UPI0039A30B40